jgi:16S rRNA (adenine1518-N6/adenine1519-N6)-dimethyltransferase
MLFSPLDSLPPLRDVIVRHDLMARKSLGQHFLCDLNLTKRIAESAGDLTGVTVIEIGPGPGGLTRSILGQPIKKLIAIEKDPRCLIALAKVVAASQGKLDVIEGDALKIDTTTLCDAPRAVIANLPYNIGTELLMNWLRDIDQYQSLTLMFQAEVADRRAAGPDNKIYGRLSVIAQFCCDVKRVMDIPARAFTPPPKVDSAVVHMVPRTDRPADITFGTIEKITAAAFGQRRKMLRSSLKPLGGEKLLKRANIDPTLRAENLALADFENLARCL